MRAEQGAGDVPGAEVAGIPAAKPPCQIASEGHVPAAQERDRRGAEPDPDVLERRAKTVMIFTPIFM